MKNKSWKLTLAAVALFCTTSTCPMAMENDETRLPEPIEKTRQILKEENQNFAISLFMDMILKGNKTYADYQEACKKEGVTPYLPVGLFTSQTKVMTDGDMETELKKAYLNLKASSNSNFIIVPPCSPLEIFNLFSGHLLPKYLDVVDQKFGKKTQLKVSKGARKEIEEFLKARQEDIDSIGDPNLMTIALKMMSFYPCIKVPGSIPMDQWSSQGLNYLFGAKPIIFSFSEIKNKEFIFSIEGFYKETRGRIEGMWFHNLNHPMTPDTAKKSILEETTSDINQIFNIGGKQVYDITKDRKALSLIFGNWFTIARQLIHFELEEWEERAPRIKEFKRQYKWAIGRLAADDQKMYSGISIAPYTLGLIRTGDKDKAESRTTLKQFAYEHYLTYEPEIKEHKEFKKDIHPTLKKAQEWFDDIFDAVSKKGRIS